MAQPASPKSGARIRLERLRTDGDRAGAIYSAEVRTQHTRHSLEVVFAGIEPPRVTLLEGETLPSWAAESLGALAAQIGRSGARGAWPQSLRRWRAPPEATLPAFYVLDVDDVVLDMDRSRPVAEHALGASLSDRYGSTRGESLRRAVVAGYEILRRQLRAPAGTIAEGYPEFLARITHWQRGLVAAGHRPKVFSRETLLAIALEDHALPVEALVVRAVVDAYWEALASASRVYADASALISTLQARGAKVHLATNSDGFLHLSEGTFVYDPADARLRKWARMEPALMTIGITVEDVTIGDPVGKPEPGFCARTLERFRVRAPDLDLTRTLAVGDSVSNDVLPFLAAGVARGAVIVREPVADPSDDTRIVTVRSLLDLERMS
ncbi:MAG: HAD family hydrolase [Deltaproteobacteria bacterium]|nr:HAD family hydrolase [Deltaproteobacteria bacterium]